MVKKIVILGSTGSIGRQAVDVVLHNPSRLKVVGISAHTNIDLLKRQIKKFHPEIVSVWNEKDARSVSSWCKKNRIKAKVYFGEEGLVKVASFKKADTVLSAVVGSAGIKPLIAAIEAGKTIALANKEALVCAGDLIIKAAKRKRVDIIPVDSEHSAIFQCLKNEKASDIKRIILTASGGPFYRSKQSLSKITALQALKHPTWLMGPKITIDSATLMNKGLEAIEAHYLFGVPLDKISIVIHPQSIVHSMVEFNDGSVIAQMSNPNMRIPIQYAILYPNRYSSSVKGLNLVERRFLEFYAPNFKRFPCLGLALKAGKAGGTMPAAMSAANEVAVKLFLEGKIGFDKIPKIVEKVMKSHRVTRSPNLRDILSADKDARETAARSYLK
jgi:1-deoxy-D-xylulose-5-phosphate reductoisomerase